MSPSGTAVSDVLGRLPDVRRGEAQRLIDVMGGVTGDPPIVWARKIIGFGTYHYRYPSGREGAAPLISFATTARQHSIYLVGGFAERYHRQLAMLGEVRVGKSCLYVTRLSDVNLDVLTVMIDRSVRVRRGVDRAARLDERST
jgi:Domain of unknown function (DU1801)